MERETKDLISRLLLKNPRERLGAQIIGENGYSALKQHPFFKGLDFQRLFQGDGPAVAHFLNEGKPKSTVSSQSFFFVDDDLRNDVQVSKRQERFEGKPSVNGGSYGSGGIRQENPKKKSNESMRARDSEPKVAFKGVVKYTVYLFFSREAKMVLYESGELVIEKEGTAKVLHCFWKWLRESKG